jgi:hypothetical protein
MLHPKEHRFVAGERAKWRVTCGEYWDIEIIKQSRLLWWLPSYTVRVIDLDGGYVVPGVLDCAIRKA